MDRTKALRLLSECEVRREDSDIDPWYMIIHPPTGKRLSAPPAPFYHPTLQRTIVVSIARRWRKATEAKAVIEEWRKILGPEQTTLDLEAP